jgi:tRNA threonylcarbamoyl adenosine modification protein (Sua5/YciO/YrdC/YwlC family)
MTCVNVREARPGPDLGTAIAEAMSALSEGRLVVVPTDTVYGVAADAANPLAVAALLAVKARGRDKPPPVLIGSVAQLAGIAADARPAVLALAEALWPGALTLVLPADPALGYDLGNKSGTVAVRVPDHQTARRLLTEFGPLAVSSANLSGAPPAQTVPEAVAQLGADVAVYLDAGRAPGGVTSTVLDTTAEPMRVLRRGAIPLAALRAIVPGVADAAGEASAKNAPAEPTR